MKKLFTKSQKRYVHPTYLWMPLTTPHPHFAFQCKSRIQSIEEEQHDNNE